jgi:hypothetical protein
MATRVKEVSTIATVEGQSFTFFRVPIAEVSFKALPWVALLTKDTFNSNNSFFFEHLDIH